MVAYTLFVVRQMPIRTINRKCNDWDEVCEGYSPIALPWVLGFLVEVFVSLGNQSQT